MKNRTSLWRIFGRSSAGFVATSSQTHLGLEPELEMFLNQPCAIGKLFIEKYNREVFNNVSKSVCVGLGRCAEFLLIDSGVALW